MFHRIASALLLVVAALPACGRSRAARPSPSRVNRIEFREALNLPGELRLAGNSNSRSVVFRCGPGLKFVEGSALHLFLRHSPELDGSRSFLSVSLNYGILRSVRLDEQNAMPGELVIPIPPGLLKTANELVLSVEQQSRPSAAPNSVWTAIDPRSYVEVEFERGTPPLDLALLPEPLLDEYGSRSKILDVLIPERASADTLEAIALMVAAFSNRVAPGAVAARTVDSIGDAQHPVLVAGTPAEQPELSLVGRSGAFLVRARPGTIELGRGEALADSEGLAGLTTVANNDSLPVLFVTGNSPRAVLRAARGLIEGGPAISGKLVRIGTDPAAVAGLPREWKGFLPPSNRFTLAGLGFEAVKIGPANQYSAAIALNATPDAAFLSHGAQATLSFQFEPALLDSDCELIAELNGLELQRAPVRKISKRTLASWTVPIPAQSLKAANVLRILVRGSLERRGVQAAGLLLPDSQFYLPRDYRAEVPDLALLRHNLYPLSLTADLSDTIVVLPDALDRNLFAALMELSSALGRLMPADRAAFRVKRMRDLKTSELSQSNFVFLGFTGLGNILAKLFPGWPLIPKKQGLPLTPVAQAVVSPWDTRKCILSVTASNSQMLEDAVRLLFSEPVLAGLAGDVAYLAPGGPRCFILARKQIIEESSFLTHLEARLKSNWLALPVILTVISGILFLALRLALARYKSGRAI